MKALIVFGGYARERAGYQQAEKVSRSGAELMAIRTGTTLACRGHEIVLLTDGPLPAVTSSLVAASLPVDGSLAGLPWVPDVVHAFDLAKPAAIRSALDVARRSGTPLVLTPSSSRQVWPDTALAAEACATAQRVMVLTRHEADDLMLPDPSVVRLIGQGPSLAGCGDAVAFRRTLPADGPVVLFLGRRSKFKGLDVLISAAPLVWRAAPAAIFAVAGPPWDRDEGIDLPDDPRFVDFGEFDLRSKTDAIAGCTLLCLPSRADVFPLVFVEAWTLSRPVISGDFPGASEVVRDRVDGIICPARPVELAAALTGLLGEPAWCEQLGRAGAERARRELTWEAVAAEVESSYGEVIGGAPR